MTKIEDILTISLDEEIKGVIDLSSQSESEVISELDSFILTESLAKHLTDFCDEYTNGSMRSGVWLSGFYGSGKSYFAKMLGYLLMNPTLQGTTMRQRFAPKLVGLPNSDFIKNTIDGLDHFKSHVVLFDSAKSSNTYGLPYMMFGNFLRSLGLLDNWIGILEYNLLIDGQYDSFLKAVEENESGTWQELRKSMIKSPGVFKRAMLKMGSTEEEVDNFKALAENHQKSYDATRLREDLERYLIIHSDTRIVFLIDEVSEAIKQDRINLLDLEGVTEALVSLDRKVWTIAIAQLKLDDVISMKNVSNNLLTKVRDRFRTAIDIKADEVDVIIKQRLLAKVDGARDELKAYYEKNSGAISDLTHLTGLNLRPTSDAETYADYYPFHEYQFRMLQYFLFGSNAMVQTKVGTRGMIISAFDVLKKEVKTSFHEHAHVTATQLCNQAELNTDEAQTIRYEQAENALKNKDFELIEGKKLLQTIYFLAETDVTQTTAENICRAYVDCPERYYDTLAEIKAALAILLDNQIVLLTGNQYRITNQTEQRILEEMRNYDVPPFLIRGEVTKALKGLSVLKALQSRTIENVPVNYQIMREDGEPIIGNASELKVLLHDINIVKDSGERSEYINTVRQNSQDRKGDISIVPATDNANDIIALATEIKRIEYIQQKQLSTDEEKRIVNTFVSELDDKINKLNEYLIKSYCNGDAVYLYNRYALNEIQFDNTIKDLQNKAYNNIYTKRLPARLPDTLAPRVLTENKGSLHSLFGPSPEFKFFDTSGKFIGTNLAVTTELLTKAASYIQGSELERQLSAPPTGYSIGTIMTSMAALFRGNKVIAKYKGNDYNSANDENARAIFQSARNFVQASFKAVSESLSYKDRNDILETLKDDCEFRKWTGESVSYNFNDYDTVNAIRDLSKAVLNRLIHEIEYDDKLSKLFSGALQAKAVLQPFTAGVHEGNCITQARAFLDQKVDYIAAVERVGNALDFIKNNFKTIENIREYLVDVKDEMSQAECDMQLIIPLVEQFDQCYANNMVANYQNILTIEQKVRDLYYKLFNGKADQVSDAYTALREKAAELRKKLDTYPREWNLALYNKLDSFDNQCEKYQISAIDIPQYEVKCRICNLRLRDLFYAQNMVSQKEQELELWQTDIVTENPNPDPQPNPSGGTPPPTPPTPPTPKTRAMRSSLPSGKFSVAQYREWLKSQLLLINKFDATDKLDFDN